MSKSATLATAFRKSLLAGLLTLSPLAITLWILVSVVRYFDQAIYSVLPWHFYVPGLGMIVAFLLLLIAGALARTYFGGFLNTFFDSVLDKVPIVRGLYSSTKQISGAFFSEDASKTFQRVVLAPFPAPPSRTLGFVSSAYSATESYVFIPTAPNPTSGYVLIYKNSELEDAHMPPEEAFKILLSCGFLTHKNPSKA
ncbi:MAG: DUF502 domain-containing protein [Bdellovibrionales bacterium]|nr:DUF502 domain-containing protein [Bdellovibrionales bacterium]